MLAARTAWRLQRSQWWDREELWRAQERKLGRLLAHAYGYVAHYRELFDQAGIRPEEIRGLEDLARIPLTSKADLQRAGGDATTSDMVRRHGIRSERTTGTTGRPFTIHLDPEFIGVRNGLFLRTLTTAGYRPGMKLFLLTAARSTNPRPWLRWRYASIEDPPERVLQEFRSFRPHVVYGCLSALRLLAGHAAQQGFSLQGPRAVVSTAEPLDATSRQLLASAFEAEVYDVYGLTETGMLGWECNRHAGLHLSEDTSIVELLPEGMGEAGQLVVTNLELHAMPFIRFRTGDLAAPGEAGPCECGRRLRRLSRVEGRLVDGVRLHGGQLVSPYQLTCALERIPGLCRFQLVQESLDSFSVRVVVDQGDSDGLGPRVQGALREILGKRAQISVDPVANLDPLPGTKFRVVDSQLWRETAT